MSNDKKPVRIGERHRIVLNGLPPNALTQRDLPELRNADETAFMRNLYEHLLEDKLRAGKRYNPGLPPSDLDVLDGDHQLKVAALPDAKRLWKAIIRAFHAESKINLNVGPPKLASTYRPPDYDFGLWFGSFKLHYYSKAKYDEVVLPKNGSKRKGIVDRDLDKIEGGRLGSKAFEHMRRMMSGAKAVAGFSNHTNGIAIDFTTRQRFEAHHEFVSLKPQKSAGNQSNWRRSWLFQWLWGDVPNAARFNFVNLKTEEWHYDHKPEEAAEVREKHDLEEATDEDDA